MSISVFIVSDPGAAGGSGMQVPALTINCSTLVRARLFLLILHLSLSAVGVCQNAEQTVAEVTSRLAQDPVRITGGLSLGAQFASISGAPARYDNFDWGLQANLNFDLLGFQVPFSAFLSDRNRLYNLPSYQFVGLSPTYKWARLHLGDRGLNFNDYTFSNQNFRGIGAELVPGKWRMAGMYGRLNRLQVGDLGARQELDISYRRMGYAAEAGYTDDRFSLKAILFRAKDEVPDQTGFAVRGLAPAENTVLSLEGSTLIGKRLTLSATVARSWITEDLSAAPLPDSILNLPIAGNASTSAEHAIRASAAYALETSNWQVTYERLSPNYRSLGTLYLTPDRENITAGTAFRLFSQKLTLALNGGLQRNNLKGDRLHTQRRVIAQLNARAQFSDRFGAQLNLSNFNNTSRLRSFLDPLSSTDSVFLAQVNRSGRLSFNLTRPQERPPGALSLSVSVQDAQSIRDELLTTTESTIFNTYLSYSGQASGSSLRYRVQLLYGITRSDITDLSTLSPSAAINKSFGEDKFTVGLSTSYSVIDYSDRQGGNVLLGVVTAGCRLTESAVLQARLQFTDRRLDDDPKLTESLAALNYSWNF